MPDPSEPGAGGSVHGKPGSWILVAVILGAFAAGGGLLVFNVWIGVYICAGVFVAAVVAGIPVGIMDDTVADTMPRLRDAGRTGRTMLEQPPPGSRHSGRTQPGLHQRSASDENVRARQRR